MCASCVFELNDESPVWGDPPPGIAAAVSSFRHEGTARRLMAAFNLGPMPSLATLRRYAAACGAQVTIGFEPAEETGAIAAAASGATLAAAT